MSVPRTRLIAIIVVAVVVALIWLLAARPDVSAPTDAASSAGPTLSSPAELHPEWDAGWLPPIDADPWEGVEWLLVAEPFGSADVLRRVEGMIDAGDRLVAWGRAPRRDRNQFNDMAAVFVSADGRAWQEVAVDHGVNAASTSTIIGVATGPLGLLAFGSVCCEPESVAIWHSADALDWQRLEIGGAIDGYLTAAIALDDGWLVQGISLDGSTGKVWFSADGSAWEAVLEVPGARFAAGLADLDRTPVGVVAVGTVVSPDGSYDGGIWRSDDGRTWERIALDAPELVGDGEAQLHRVVGHRGGMLVTGIFGTAEQRRQCEELIGMVAAAVPRPPGPPPRDFTMCMSGWEHVWASPDGVTWERADLREATGQLEPIEFRVIAAGGPGLVLLGETGRPASPDTTLFTSADGLTWRAVEPPAPVGLETAIAVAVRGREVITVSERSDGVTSSFQVRIGSARP